MPRPSEGIRLYVRKRRGRPDMLVIRDDTREISTGCRVSERGTAEQKLRDYIDARYKPDFRDGDPAQVLIAEVIAFYNVERAPHTARPDIVKQAVPHLVAFFQEDTVKQATPARCRAYVQWRTEQPQRRFRDPETAPRVGAQTARRELEVLSAAIGFAHREHKLDYPIVVALPDKAPPKDRHLTRQEAARLLRAAWRGEAKHAARFILLGLYTGTRHDAILKLRWLPSIEGGWVDLDAGMLHRKGQRQVETSKRRPPVPISGRLAAHLRRWKAQAARDAEAEARAARKSGREAATPQSLSYVISWKGESLRRLRRAWNTARVAAGLGPEVTPHVLRHTFASWAIQDGHSLEKIAASLGTTTQVIEKTYAAHVAERLRDVVETVSGAQSGARRRKTAESKSLKIVKNA